MNNLTIRNSIQKGLVFGIVIVFMVLIDFHVTAATLASKAFGVDVLRGSNPEVRFMTIIHILFAFWTGWSATGKNGKILTRLKFSAITILATTAAILLFDTLLHSLIQSEANIRDYLPALSNENMEFFLLQLGSKSTQTLAVIYIAGGIVGSLLAIFFRLESVRNFWEKSKASAGKLNTQAYEALPPFLKKFGKFVLYAMIVALLIYLPTVWGSYWNFVVGLVGLYVIAGIGLNIIVGLSGQLVLGYAAFIAMGAYSVALLNAPEPHNLMWGFWPAILIAVIMAVLAAIVLGLPLMRLRGDYLAIVTLGFGEIIRILLKSDLLTNFTGGPRGIHDIHGPTLFGMDFSSDSNYVYLIFAGVAFAIFVFNRLQNSRTGRAWLAIKGDAIAAQATGINLQRYKLLALCIGAAFAGLVGGISAARNQFTGPNDHSLMVSINVLSIIIVGGVNSIPGIILGAFTLKGLPEILREVENYRQLAFSALLIVMMLMRPNGLWPSSRPLIEKTVNPVKVEEEFENEGERNG